MRRTLVLTLAMVILFSASPSDASLEQRAEKEDSFEILSQTFLLSGAELSEIKLQAWGQITNRKLSPDELIAIINKFCGELDLNREKPVVQTEKGLFTSVSLMAGGDTQSLQLVLQSVAENPHSGFTCLGFLFATGEPDRARVIYQKMLPLLREIGYTDELGITVTGTLRHYLPPLLQETLIEKMAMASGADFVEGIRGDLTCSSFYTSRLNSGICVGDRKVNLQIAARSVPGENKTRVYVGMPLIFQDY
jgi:hypothetical protein